MKTFIQKIITWAKAHKIMGAVVLLALIGAGYGMVRAFGSDTSETRYVLGTVKKGTIVASISASGQVSASNQVEIQPKASGEIIYIGVKEGQTVKNGAVIAQIDSKTAQKSVRDAEVNLESANLSLEKLKKSADTLSVLQAENALAQAKESKQKAADDLKKAYEDGFNTISNAFLALPGVMTGLDDTFFDEGDFEAYQWNIDWYLNQFSLDSRDKGTRYRDDVYAAYNKARTAYTKTFDDYKAASRTSEPQTIESLITETYETTKLIAEAVKVSNNYIDFVQDDMEKYDRNIPSLLSTHQSNLDSYTGTTNSHLLSLLSIQTTLRTSRETITNSDRTIAEKTESLTKLKTGTDPLDIRSSELSVVKAQNTLQDAKNTLADYYIRAPFDGVVASLDIQKGQTVSSAAVATLITKQKVATLSVNEVDAAQIKVGNKATLSFDAIEDLTLTGEVAAIDTIGTVTQGVVSYELKVVFDSQDERIKSGMTANAAIQTATKQDVLVVPSSAVKTQNGVSYVQVFDPPLEQAGGTQGVVSALSPRQVEVVIGIADDANVEITSGLEEGQQVVTRTVSGTTTNSPAATRNATNRGGGGGVFIPR